MPANLENLMAGGGHDSYVFSLVATARAATGFGSGTGTGEIGQARAEAEALVQAASDARDQALAAREAQHLKAADQRAATAEARAEAARADAERELGRLR
jgi:hypothetical protein